MSDRKKFLLAGLIIGIITLLLTSCPGATNTPSSSTPSSSTPSSSTPSSGIPSQQVDAPTFSPTAGTYTGTQTVIISTTTLGSSIRYTTDGSTPTETIGTVYSAAISVGSSETIKAIAYKSDWTDSIVATAAYTISTAGQVAAPTFNPPAGTYTGTQTVTISTTTSGSSIRYTTDGSTPTGIVGTAYSEPISVPTSETINAIAYEAGWTASAVVTAVYTLQISPPTPTGLAVVSASANSLNISWNASTGAISYQLYRNGTLVYDDGSTSFTDTGLTPRATYSYTVIATNAFGSSALSAAVTATTVPLTPTGLTVGSATVSTLNVSWNASSGATSYWLYHNGTLVYYGSNTSYSDSGLTVGTSYTYTVKASNSAGSSALSAPVLGTTLGVPPTPTGLTVGSATVSSLSVSWTASTEATSYQLYRSSTQVYNGSNTTYTDTGLTSSSTYSYTVQATNRAGTSALSAVVTGTTVPLTPTGLTLGSATSNSISLSWAASSGARAYQLYRNGTQVYYGIQTTYIDTGFSPGLTYSYAVQATNSGGSSARSAAVLWTTIPATPTRLTVEMDGASANSLNISWDASTGATSYQLYRNGTQVYNGSGGFYHDTELTAGTTYSYAVEASNMGGSSALSAALLWTTIPATPKGFTVGGATVSSLSISWDASTGATSYQLFRGSTQVYSGSNTTYTDTGLSSGLTYSYTVQASNNGGSRALSTAASGTTLP